MSAKPGCGRTVLVVEDEFLVAMSIVHALEQNGHSVLGPAPTVAAALAALDAGLPDLALLDANLRGQSVAPVADRLAGRGVPYALVTGYAGPLPDGVLLNGVPRLRKPFTVSEVAALVDHLAAGSAAT